MYNINIFKSRSGIECLEINGVNIYSKYDPLKEVSTFWDNNSEYYKDKSSILIYGLGLGYHALELINRVPDDFQVYIFDIENYLDYIIDQKSIKSLLTRKNVHVIVGKNNLKKFSELIYTIKNLIIIDSLYRVISEANRKFKTSITDYKIALKGIDVFGDKMKKCYISNTQLMDDPIEKFINIYNSKKEAIVLVAAGPSLDEKSIEIINAIRENVLLFCVGRSLRGLLNKGLKPDMFSIIDCGDVVYEHVKGLENEDICMTYLSTANSMAVSRYQGPRYIFFNENIGQDYIIETGKSVSTAIFDIALKCSPKKIILFGYDFAYTNLKGHSEFSKCSYDKGIDSSSYKKTVISNNGEYIPTTEGFLLFKRWVERKISMSNSICVYNYGDGAKIEGTISVDEVDILKLIRGSE